MKTNIITPLLLLLFVSAYSQNSKFELPEDPTISVKRQKVIEAKLVTDLSPLIWSNLSIPFYENYFLERRRVNVYPQAADYVYPQEKYKEVIDYVSVEISTVSGGKTYLATSSSDQLTQDQKNILNTADLGADISIKIKFKYKNEKSDEWGSRDKVIQGESLVAIVPENEAAFPGGIKKLSEYFAGNVIDKISKKDADEKIRRAILKFTIDEEGQILNAKLSKTSTSPEIDKLILEATTKMPKWKPAENGNGTRVKQEISIPFGGGGC